MASASSAPVIDPEKVSKATLRSGLILYSKAIIPPSVAQRHARSRLDSRPLALTSLSDLNRLVRTRRLGGVGAEEGALPGYPMRPPVGATSVPTATVRPATAAAAPAARLESRRGHTKPRLRHRGAAASGLVPGPVPRRADLR